MEKELLKKLMSELGKRSADKRKKLHGNFGEFMKKYKSGKLKKLSPVIHT